MGTSLEWGSIHPGKRRWGDALPLKRSCLGGITYILSIERYFEKQIDLAEATGLPMFLHCRAAAADLVSILGKRRDNIVGGVVHSFDGTSDELRSILDLDLYVGVNGW